jgi:serine/threonine-protein kinase
MVGAFGEVQVMDWGLAKVLGSPPTSETGSQPDDTSALAPVRTAGEDLATHAGAILGTPAFMAPEQARGEIARLDERADVFGLGAILCVLLTGQPPYVGLIKAEVYRQAKEAALTDAYARLQACGADADLVRLAKGCLQPQVEDRPRNAAMVAEQVTAYLVGVQERLRQAEMERAAAQAREEEARARAEEVRARAEAETQALRAERRARQRTLALAAAVLLLVGGVGAAGWWYQGERAEAARKLALTEQAVRQSLDQAQDSHDKLLAALNKPGEVQELLNQPARWELQLRTSRADWQRAQALAANAEGSLDPELTEGLQKLEQQLVRDQADYKLALGLEKIRLDQATWVEGKFDTAQALKEYPQTFQEAGLVLEPGQEKETAQRIGQSAIKEQLLAALDDWALKAQMAHGRDLCQRLLKTARLADPHPWRDRLRDSARWNDRKAIAQLAAEVEGNQAFLARLSPQMLFLVSGLLPKEKQEAWLRFGQGLHPADFWLNFELAVVLARTKERGSEAAGYYRVALAIRPNSVAVSRNLGLALYNQEDLDGTIAAYQKALALDPKYAALWNDLGNALHKKKDLARAITAYKQALALEPRYAHAWHNLGLALGETKDLAGAIAAFQKTLALDPKNAGAWQNLGFALRDHGEFEKSLAAFRSLQGLAAAQSVWKQRADQEVARAEQLVELDRQLPSFLKGEVQPRDAAQGLELADLCTGYKQRYAAARFYAEPSLPGPPGAASALTTPVVRRLLLPPGRGKTPPSSTPGRRRTCGSRPSPGSRTP